MKYDDYMNDEYMNDGDELEACEECEEPEEKFTKKTKMIEVEEVLGIGSSETVVEVCIPLCPPAFEILHELISKNVEFDALVASKGKVFINGRIVKDIPYKTRVKTCLPGCERISKLTFGNIKHVTAEVPFALCIDVPESFKGAKVVVLETDVNSVEIPNFVNCLPNRCEPKCEPLALRLDNCHRKLICSITEKDCIFVKVKVVKDSIMTIPCKDAKF